MEVFKPEVRDRDMQVDPRKRHEIENPKKDKEKVKQK